ncbi:MAG TPA: DivIVA domain-containing protein [Chthonomonadaceae bacterium]|nr:DivIVA domain-containing protein [Chthonomonadaceae bacterium]
MRQDLTPIDILNVNLRRSLRGYSVAEVDEFKRQAAAALEHALAECAALRERMSSMERELGQFRTMEATLRDALVLAQKAADETRAAAHSQAEARLQEAQARAQELEARMQARVAELNTRIEALRQERRRLVRDLRAQLLAQLEWLTAEMEADPEGTPQGEGPAERAQEPAAALGGSALAAIVRANPDAGTPEEA